MQGKRYGSGSVDEQVMGRLGEVIGGMKDDFIVVHLQEPCSLCREYISDGPRCDSCHFRIPASAFLSPFLIAEHHAVEAGFDGSHQRHATSLLLQQKLYMMYSCLVLFLQQLHHIMLLLRGLRHTCYKMAFAVIFVASLHSAVQQSCCVSTSSFRCCKLACADNTQ